MLVAEESGLNHTNTACLRFLSSSRAFSFSVIQSCIWGASDAGLLL